MRQPSHKPRSAAALLFWTLTALLVPSIVFVIIDHHNPLLAIANVLLAAALYCGLLTITRKIGRSLAWMWFFFSLAGFQTVIIFIYGAEPIGVDMFLNILMANQEEATELLGNLLTAMIVVGLLYLPLYALDIWAWAGKWEMPRYIVRHVRRAATMCMLCGLGALLSGMAVDRDFQPLRTLFPFNAVNHMCKAAHRYWHTIKYDRSSADFSYKARSERPDSIDDNETYVLVIGETSRADNWHILGYTRDTSPGLDRESNLVAFPKAFTSSNTTFKSVPLMLSSLNASNYGDSIFYTKGIATAFREAGFRTYFFSNQARNHQILDKFGQEADSCVFLRDSNPRALDGDLLPLLDSALRSSAPKKLIILHTYGAHFNYSDRYPESFAHFKPHRTYDANPETRPVLINSYDNVIRYTDRLLCGVIDRLKATSGPASMMYTSDHGEDIFDDERNLVLHSSPTPTYMQLHVPLFVWYSDSYASTYPDIVANMRSNVGRPVWVSDAVFNTMVDIAGIETPYHRHESSVANKIYHPGAYLYLDDYDKGVDLRHTGMAEVDIERMP